MDDQGLRYAPFSDPSGGAILWVPHLASALVANAEECRLACGGEALPPPLPEMLRKGDLLRRYEEIARALAPPPSPAETLCGLADAANVASFLDDGPLLGRILAEIARRFEGCPAAVIGRLDGDLLAPLARAMGPPARADLARFGGEEGARCVEAAERGLPAYDRHVVPVEGYDANAAHLGVSDGIVFPCEIGWIAASPSGSHLAAVVSAREGGVRVVCWDARGGAAWSEPTPASARDGSRVTPAQFAIAVGEDGRVRAAAGGEVFEIDPATGHARVAVDRNHAGPVPLAVAAASPDLESVAYVVDYGDGPVLAVALRGFDTVLPSYDACGRSGPSYASWNRTGDVILYARGGERRRLRMGSTGAADKRYADYEERNGHMEAAVRSGDGWIAWSASLGGAAVEIGRDGRCAPLLGHVRLDPEAGIPLAWDEDGGEAWLEFASGRIVRIAAADDAAQGARRVIAVDVGRVEGGATGRLERAVRLGPGRVVGVRGANRLLVRMVRVP